MMYLPNRTLELFEQQQSLEGPPETEMGVLERLEKFAQLEMPSYRQQACLDLDEALSISHAKEDLERIKQIAVELAGDPGRRARVNPAMMYLPNRTLELFEQQQSLEGPPETEMGVLERLEKFAQLEMPSYRQQACLDLDEALSISHAKEDLERIKQIAVELAGDPDLNVRVSLLDQLQYMGLRCVTPGICRETFFSFISCALCSSLKDQNHQVRKAAQSSLILLTTHGFYAKRDLDHIFVDRIQEMLQPTSNDLMDIKVSSLYLLNSHEAVTLISALATQIGGETITAKFLDRFLDLCSDQLLHVRKCCATSFAKFCQVCDRVTVEQKLLPALQLLCGDTIWGVRKACAEGFTIISEGVSQRARVQILTPLFLRLLDDTSRYVKMAAYQQLGPFITTFHSGDNDNNESQGDEQKTKSEPRERSPTNPEYDDFLFWKSPVDNFSTDELEQELLEEQKSTETETPTNEISDGTDDNVETDSLEEGEMVTENDVEEHQIPPASLESQQPDKKEELTGAVGGDLTDNKNISLEGSLNENEQTPPVVNFRAGLEDDDDDDVESMQIEEGGMQMRDFFTAMIESDDKENQSGEDVFDGKLAEKSSDQWGIACEFNKDPLCPKIINLSEDKEDNSDGSVMVGSIDITKPVFGVTSAAETYSFSPRDDDLELASDTSDMEVEAPVPATSIVPGALIDCYKNMACNFDETNPRADDDILTHCAYAFPGVVHTLGRDSWSVLKKAYLTLAKGLPPSMAMVRQTLACSIHEIAHVIGPQQTQEDLIIPFQSFIDDIDSVKIGLLKNLSHFLKNVSLRHREELLYQMKEIQKCEDQKNWRYRQTFANQLPQLSELYTTKEVYDHIQPIVFDLSTDQVSQVRRASFTVLSKLVQRFQNEPEYLNSTCNLIRNKFGNSNRCTYRQGYVLICREMIRDGQYDLVKAIFLERLLELVDDRTPNVRLWVAQCLLLISENLKSEDIQTSLSSLRQDPDTDVRHYAMHVVHDFPTHDYD
eukprot:sb/3461608/